MFKPEMEGSSKEYIALYSLLDTLFLEHPRGVGETYLQHMYLALSIARYLTIYCLGPLVFHALVPYFFQTTASTHIFTLSNILKQRRGLSKSENDNNGENNC